MKTNLTLNNTGYIAEWWHQKPGEPTRYYTRKAIRDAERIAAKRGDVVTDEHVGHGRPGMTVLKPCQDCGSLFAPQFGATSCGKCRAARSAATRKVAAR